MSSSAQQHKDGRISNVNRGSVVITRSGPTHRVSTSTRMSNSLSPGTIHALSNTGVTDIKGTRQREKKDLQDLNERFAGYIDKVHFLEANCKRLEAENEALRNRKEADFGPARKAYENELAQTRAVIDELTATKGVAEAKLAGLQDEVDGLRELIQTYESQAKDYKKKIESLGNQVGEYEGELTTLRLRVGSLEDENAKLRDLLNKVQDQNRRLRADLDAETAAHIESDGIAQTKGDEAEFYKDLLDEFELMKPEPVQIKGMDYGDFWKSEMQKAVRNITQAYDDKLETMQVEIDQKYATQVNALRNGNVKDNMTMQRSKEDISRLKGQLADKNSSYAELATKLAALQSERDELARSLAELERENESLRIKYETDIGDLQDELTSVLAQLQTLIDAKMSLELEIATYKKLLEGEEQRVGLKALVEKQLGAQEKGAVQNVFEAALKDQSSSVSSSVLASQPQSLPGGPKSDALRESTGSLTVQRSSKGPIAFKSMDHSGGNVIIENTSTGARSKSQNLKGWRLVKTANGREAVSVVLKDFELQSGKTFTLWARGAKESGANDNEQIADNFSFGLGTCVWKLLDENSAEKATLTAKFSG